jgi:acetylglutamate kinase
MGENGEKVSTTHAEKIAHLTRELLPWILKHGGKTFVIKIGGSCLESSPALLKNAADNLVLLNLLGIKTVLLHGGQHKINRALERAGRPTSKINGQRVTEKEDVPAIDDALSEVNADLVGVIEASGGKAFGFAGRDIIQCSRSPSADLGYVGVPEAVRTIQIQKILDQGIIPVISPTGRDKDGQIYNINADLSAQKVAEWVEATRLIYVSDMAGVLRNVSDPLSLMREIFTDEVPALIEHGVITGGMIPKVTSAVDAIDAGVEGVVFIDGREEDALLLEIGTNLGVGTQIRRRPTA